MVIMQMLSNQVNFNIVTVAVCFFLFSSSPSSQNFEQWTTLNLYLVTALNHKSIAFCDRRLIQFLHHCEHLPVWCRPKAVL